MSDAIIGTFASPIFILGGLPADPALFAAFTRHVA
jgi:hypothetical protein